VQIVSLLGEMDQNGTHSNPLVNPFTMVVPYDVYMLVCPYQFLAE
jgi:hypothetical protein